MCFFYKSVVLITFFHDSYPTWHIVHISLPEFRKEGETVFLRAQTSLTEVVHLALMNTDFTFCNKALMAGLQYLMYPPHTSLHFLLRGNLNKCNDNVGREKLNTFHLFTGLSNMVPFFAAATNSVSLETNPTPLQCSQFPLSLAILAPKKLHCCTFMLGKKAIWTTLFFQSNYLEKDMLCLLY